MNSQNHHEFTDDFRPNEKSHQPEIKNRANENLTTESDSLTATYETTNNKKTTKNNNNDETREYVSESSDADATRDNNDSILASVASIDDKDKLIEFLTNKLLEKDRKETELSQEIERLRNLLK